MEAPGGPQAAEAGQEERPGGQWEASPDQMPPLEWFPTQTEETIETRSPSRASRHRTSCRCIPHSMMLRLRAAKDSKAFKCVTFACLLFALFGWTVVLILDIPDEPTNLIIDVLMLITMGIFVLELVIRSMTDRCKYPLTFFYCMDVVGTASMVFEISWLLGEAGKIDSVDSSVDAVLIRTTRAARLGARAGRLAKVLKCLHFMHSVRRGQEEERRNEAKVLGKRVREVLSAKVSMLTIVLVLGVPLFALGRYPEEDLSMKAYGRRLEVTYSQAYDSLASSIADANMTTEFSETVEDMLSFYSDLSYCPYRLEGYATAVVLDTGRDVSIPGDGLLSGAEPRRKQNIVRQEAKACQRERPGCSGGERAAIYFDFTEAKMYGAGMDLAVIFFIMMCMILESWDLSRTLDAMAVRPVDKMMAVVSRITAVLRQVERDGRRTSSDSAQESLSIMHGVDSNSELLEEAFRKLVDLTTVFLQDSVVDNEDMQDLHHESKGVIVDIMQLSNTESPLTGPGRPSRPSQASDTPVPQRLSTSQMSTSSPARSVANLDLEPQDLDYWGLDIIGMSAEQQSKVVMHILFDSTIGARTGHEWAEVEKFEKFVEGVRGGYLDNPYHNFTHACDVVVSMYRILQTLKWSRWLNEMDTYALLVSALAHDIGHPGKTNPFLVETCHELSLRYNDKSPLENMHCAQLFTLCTDPAKNVFSLFDKGNYKRARNICITAILATDNAKHFEMVKEIKKCYQLNACTCALQMEDPEDYTNGYVEDVLRKDTMLWIKMLLHLADIANPLKPFGTYRKWASRVLDEFFAQGDEEKRLGIPVGMLNDREKVSMPGSEHGFINFLVAPLVTSAAYIFPTMYPLAQQMATNMEQWREVWVEEANPSQEDIAKRDADIQAVKDIVSKLGPSEPNEPESPLSRRPSQTIAGGLQRMVSMTLGGPPVETGRQHSTDELSPPQDSTMRSAMRRISREFKKS